MITNNIWSFYFCRNFWYNAEISTAYLSYVKYVILKKSITLGLNFGYCRNFWPKIFQKVKVLACLSKNFQCYGYSYGTLYIRRLWKLKIFFKNFPTTQKNQKYAQACRNFWRPQKFSKCKKWPKKNFLPARGVFFLHSPAFYTCGYKISRKFFKHFLAPEGYI